MTREQLDEAKELLARLDAWKAIDKAWGASEKAARVVGCIGEDWEEMCGVHAELNDLIDCQIEKLQKEFDSL